jgi:uncharacterized protein (TIGR02147 family)
MSKTTSSAVKKGAPTSPTVYGQTDYRQFLREFYAHRKAGERGYSFRIFARQAGFNTPNILKLVMDGQRNLTPESTEKFIIGLSLNAHSADYFRVLVQMNQTSDDAEKIRCYEKLIQLTPHAKKRDLDADSVEYLSHWLYPVLRELILLPSFREDPYWIAQKLCGSASVAQIVSALTFLEKSEFIVRDENGRFVPKDNMVLSSDEVRSLAIRQYHRMLLDQAKERLSDLEKEDREYGALTFLLPQNRFDDLKAKLKDIRRSLHLWALEAARDQSCEDVIQVNIMMYPQTKRNKR